MSGRSHRGMQPDDGPVDPSPPPKPADLAPTYPADCNRAILGNDCGCGVCRTAFAVTTRRNRDKFPAQGTDDAIRDRLRAWGMTLVSIEMLQQWCEAMGFEIVDAHHPHGAQLRMRMDAR